MERKDGDEPLPSHLQHVDMNSEGSGTSDSGDVPRGPDGSSILLVDSRHPLDAPGRSIPLMPVLLPSSTGKDNHDNATSLSGATRPNEASHPAFPSSVPFLTTEELRTTLENFYRAHNPKNADKIDAFLKRYQGREPQLLLDVQAKYKDGGVHITDYMPNTVDVEACVSVLEEKNSRADTSAVCNRRESTALSSFFAPGDSKPAVKAKGDNHSASSSVDVGVLPALLLKAFKKKDSTHSQPQPLWARQERPLSLPPSLPPSLPTLCRA
ncbi:hypothetical protein Naga_100064g2 [Nannochloropsis gaditana]|uniref:Uncharacterized protein n=1 Tax=Nannochloropsis gaditana TaxID=72520 RepID=W7TN58_9STRA|nr:hypothetical protein Naga_100064g2 [Nannochloropsis gaditana]